ncbi:MAG: hypothetical protein AB1Z23_03100 [Eubacteriales bacterium]
MKAKVISLVSALALIGVAVLAMVIVSKSTTLAVIAVALSLVPMYLLYITLVLGKFDEKDQRHLSPRKRIESMLKPSEYAETNEQYWKRIEREKPFDTGKILEFDKDKKKDKEDE